MSNYIGKTISLVDTQKIRYIGVLASISAETTTVVLENVTVYGTEGRRGGADEIPPESQVRPRIEFKGKDVEDLQVLDTPVVPSRTNTGQTQTETPKQTKQDQPRSQRPQPQEAGADSDSDESVDSVDEDDFVTRTLRLTKGEAMPSGVDVAYNKKSSFFDNFSPQNAGRYTTRDDLNVETFGEDAPRQQRSQRGGRGGRARGSGRGHGGRRGGRDDRETRGDSSRPPHPSHASDEWEVVGSGRSGRSSRGSRGGRGGRGGPDGGREGGRDGGRSSGRGASGSQQSYTSFQPGSRQDSNGGFS